MKIMIRIDIESDETKFKYRNVARFVSAQKKAGSISGRSLGRARARFENSGW